jgi:hypothetical protein
MLSALIGMAVAVVSLWGMWRWRVDLIAVVRGFFPLCFFLGGVVAVIAGISSLNRTEPENKRPGLGKNQ